MALNCKSVTAYHLLYSKYNCFRISRTLDAQNYLKLKELPEVKATGQHELTSIKMTLFFSGYFSLLEFLRCVGYICHAQEKDSVSTWRIFREIERAEYFDSILARLSIEDLEKMTMQFEDQMKEIVIGEKYDCWRHKVFLYGSCEEYPNQSKLQLSNFDKFAGFSSNQIKIIKDFFSPTYY